MTGAYIDRFQYLKASKLIKKILSPLNSPPCIFAEYEISSKLKHLLLFVQNYGLKDGTCHHWEVSRITQNYCHQWIQYLQIVHYAKFRGKWLASFPVPHSSFPFLKMVYFELRYGWEDTRIRNIRSKSS